MNEAHWPVIRHFHIFRHSRIARCGSLVSPRLELTHRRMFEMSVPDPNRPGCVDGRGPSFLPDIEIKISD